MAACLLTLAGRFHPGERPTAWKRSVRGPRWHHL